MCFNTQSSNNNSNTTVLYTPGGQSTSLTGVCVELYGKKFADTLLPFDFEFKNDKNNNNNSANDDDESSRAARLSGLISRPEVNQGRPTTDRQLFFINNRPCHLTKVLSAHIYI